MLMDKKKMVLLVVGLLYYHLFISSMNVEIETSEPHFFFFFKVVQVNPIEKHEWRWMFYDIVIPQRCLRIPV